MKIAHLVCAVLMSASLSAVAQGNLEIDSPAIGALKQSMQQRHAQLAPLYQSGAVGIAADGSVALRSAASVPLAQRGQVNALISAENADRSALYREIARANGHPEWENDVRKTFAQRWVQRAQSGWWVQQGGGWVQK